MLRDVVTGAFLLAGVFFVIVAAIGVLRFPDFYSRMHPGGKCDTLGVGLVFAGMIVHEGLTMVSLKLMITLVFIFIANPTATHALARAAHVAGVRPWQRPNGGGEGADGA